MSGQGAMIGAAVGGAYGLATGKDPLKSAMIGAAVGSGGGALMGAGAAGAGAGAGAAGAGAGAAGAGTAGTALSYGAANLGTAGTTSASPSLLSKLSGGFQSANTWANQNPFTANMAMQTAGSLLAPVPPPEMAPPPGLMRGQQFQMEDPTQYAMGSPRISLI